MNFGYKMQTTYHKLWTFIKIQSFSLLFSKNVDSKYSLRRGSSEIMSVSIDPPKSLISVGRRCSENPQQQRPKVKSSVLALKYLAYFDAVIQIAVGFAIVTTVAYFCPQLVNDPTRLAVFWMYSFTHLFLGFLTFIGLYQNSAATLKILVCLLVVLQLAVLITFSKLLGECNGTKTQSSLVTVDLDSRNPQVIQCKNLVFASSRIILPNFIHSLIFCAILITYLYKKSSTSVEEEIPEDKKILQFANIKIIIEEVA